MSGIFNRTIANSLMLAEMGDSETKKTGQNGHPATPSASQPACRRQGFR